MKDRIRPGDFQHERALARLREANRRLLQKLADAKATRAELVAAVHRAASDAFAGLTIAPVARPRLPRSGRGDEEVAVVFYSDLQLGKRTPTYNTEVCERRIAAYADKVIRLTEIQRADHPVRAAHVWMLGDIVENEDIFPGQSYLIDSSLYRQVAVDGPRITCNFLRRLLSYFDRLVVYGIIGNHGRIGRKGVYSPESNADRMLYAIVGQLLAEESRIEWVIPQRAGERDWYAIDRIGNYSCMLFHGDQIRGGGFAGFPFYGLAKRVWGWRSGGIPEEFRDVAFGHWHQAIQVPLNDTIAWGTGSPESSNTWLQENFAASGPPSQRLNFVSPKRGIVTNTYIVWL